MNLARHIVEHAALGIPYAPVVVTAGDMASIQAANDTASASKTQTVIQLTRGQRYEVAPGVTTAIDSAYVQVDLNGATVSVATWGATLGAAFRVYSSELNHSNTGTYIKQKVVLKGGLILGDLSKYLGTDDGPYLVQFDSVTPGGSPTDYLANRCQMEEMMLLGGRQGTCFGSSSYMVKVHNCDISRNFNAVGSISTTPRDVAEQIEFNENVFGENGVAYGPTTAGQIYNVKGGSLDYNRQICNLTFGTSLRFHNKVHIEFSYGSATGETTTPFVINSSSGAITGNVALVYTGANNPKFSSFATVISAANQIKLDIIDGRGLARTKGGIDRKSLDAFCLVLASVVPQISIRVSSPTANAADFPGMAWACEGLGIYGSLRYGQSAPIQSVGHIIGKSGTANAIANVTADENGVTRMTNSAAASLPMLKFQNGTPGTAAKYYWCVQKPMGRKMAWASFFNTAATGNAGTFTVRERRNGPGMVFDGTTVSFASASNGAEYQGTTLTLSPATSSSGTDWNRYDYRDCAGAGANLMTMSPPLEQTPILIVELDLTNWTGPLYMASFGSGPIGDQL
jgi:hypothetical protein